MRNLWTILIFAVACSGPMDEPAPVRDGGGRDLDAGVDANWSGDVRTEPDLASPTDLGVDMSPDFGDAIMCTTGSADGVCLDVSACPADRMSVPGFCPGPTNIQCCVAVVVAGMCNENPSWDAMPRPNEGLAEAAGDGGCPSGMAPVDGFCVDRYEASLIEILDDGSERSWSPFFNPINHRVRAVSIANAVPQGYITQIEAAAACSESGKRLCTDTEWLRACQGPAGSTFPYGDVREPGVCNDARAVHPVIDYFDSTDDSIWSKLGNACINQQEDSLAKTGAHPSCVSADGLYDMMGNLHEWTADPTGTFRGGFYADTEINGPGCLYRTTAHNTEHWDYSTGFRCCADP